MNHTPRAQASLGVRVAMGTTAIGLVLATFSSAATQYVAFKTGFHPALGHPLVGQFYAPWAWIEWLQAPFAARIATALDHAKIIMGAGASATVGFPLMRALQGMRKPKAIGDLHGSSRWATEADIKKLGLYSGKGILLGEYKGKFLRFGRPGHAAVIAPTRTGKGISIALPNVLGAAAGEWSFLVNDEKCELVALTKGWLQSIGTTVHRWQPGSPDHCEAKFNFLDLVRDGTDYEVSDAQNVALMLLDPEGKGLSEGKGDPHWKLTAHALLSAVILFTKMIPGASLPDVAALVYDPSSDDPERLYRAMGNCAKLFVSQAGVDILSKNGKEAQSIISTMRTAVDVFRDPIVAANCAFSTFDITQLVDSVNPHALFMCFPGNDLLRLRALKRLFQAAVMRTLMSKPLEFVEGQPLQPYRHKLLAIMDEFPSDGRQPDIEAAMPKIAAWGVTFLLIIQDVKQLQAVYGQNESILANCAIRVAFTPNTDEAAEWVSKSAGETTIIAEEFSESGKRHGNLGSVSRTIRAHSRRLITPDEVKRLEMSTKTSAGELLVFTQGGHPIRARQVPYYLNPGLLSRSRVPA